MSMLLRVVDSFDSGKVYHFPHIKERKLKFSKVINGGDDKASWEMPCAHLGRGIPSWGSNVQIIDQATGAIRWLGFLKEPKPKVINGKLVSATFDANGYYYTAQKDKFGDPVSFGPAVTEVTNVFKQDTLDIADAVTYAMTELCPLLTGGTDEIATLGINLTEASQSFQGQTAVAVWNAMALFCANLYQLIIWKVEANASGVPKLKWYLEPGSPLYFDPGAPNGLEVDLGFDMDMAANVSTVLWGNTQKWTEPFPFVLDETIIPPNFTTRNVVQAGGNIRSYDDIQGLARGTLARFNRMRATSGQVIVKHAVASSEGGPADVPPDAIEVGQVMRLVIPDLGRYHLSGDSERDVLIQRMEYDEDSCATTLSLLPFDDAGRNARIMGMVASQGAFVHWSIMFPQQVAGIDLGHYEIFGPTAPLSYSGIAGDPDNLRVEPGLGVYIKGAGDYGGVHSPDSLPDNRLDMAYDIPSADGGVITAGDDYLSVPIQPGIIEWINIKAKEGESGTIQLKFDRLQAGGTKNLDIFGTIELTASHGPHRYDLGSPFICHEGDWIIARVLADAVGISKVSIGLHGKKQWPELPHPVAPDHVP